MEEKITKVIASVLHLDEDQITSDKTFDDLGADSLDKVEIIMQLEDELGISISDEDAESIVTVGDAIEKATKALG